MPHSKNRLMKVWKKKGYFSNNTETIFWSKCGKLTKRKESRDRNKNNSIADIKENSMINWHSFRKDHHLKKEVGITILIDSITFSQITMQKALRKWGTAFPLWIDKNIKKWSLTTEFRHNQFTTKQISTLQTD